MRIAFIVDSFPNVSETFVLRQMQGLVREGHEILIFTGSAADPSGTALFKGDKALLAQVRVYNRKPANRWLRALCAIGLAPLFLLRSPSALFNSLNVSVHGAEAWSLNYYFQAFAFAQVKVDAVIAHFGPNGLVGARMKKMKILPERLICFFHAYDLSSYVARMGREVYAPLFEQCTRAAAISERGAARLRELGCPPEKVHLMRMGVDVDQYLYDVRRSDPSRPLRIVTVARLVEKKGISVGIEMIRLLNERGIRSEYVVVGDGPLRGALEAQAARAGLESKVFFPGALGQDEVRGQMYKAGILLLPSITAGSGDEEGVPVVLMEAMACGLPVIASDSGAVREIVIDGETGTLVPPGEPRLMVDAVLRLLAGRGRTEAMAEAGRRLVEEKYNSSVLIKELGDMLLPGDRLMKGE
jgi:colanic acid/amylovoran biosynthesis glycosyltransferase